MPYLEINGYGTDSEVCNVKSYSIYEDINDLDNPIVHSEFDDSGVGQLFNDTVRFFMNVEELAYIEFYIEVISWGGGTENRMMDKKIFYV